METEFSGRDLLFHWLNRPMCIQLTDGRKVVGTFLCTDNDCNIILGQTREYWPAIEQREEEKGGETMEEPRLLGLTMVPGRHIVSISIDTFLEKPITTTPNCKEESGSSADTGSS